MMIAFQLTFAYLRLLPRQPNPIYPPLSEHYYICAVNAQISQRSLKGLWIWCRKWHVANSGVAKSKYWKHTFFFSFLSFFFLNWGVELVCLCSNMAETGRKNGWPRCTGWHWWFNLPESHAAIFLLPRLKNFIWWLTNMAVIDFCR